MVDPPNGDLAGIEGALDAASPKLLAIQKGHTSTALVRLDPTAREMTNRGKALASSQAGGGQNDRPWPLGVGDLLGVPEVPQIWLLCGTNMLMNRFPNTNFIEHLPPTNPC